MHICEFIFGNEKLKIICYIYSMTTQYYNGNELVDKEEFDKERKRIITERIKEAENDENLIDDEDLDYYLNELQKMEK